MEQGKVKPDLLAIGARVKLLRVENSPHQTQAEFGEKLGTSGHMISKIERGHSEPTLTFLLRLSELTGRSIDWIVKGEEK
jgi:transcriptional regulator with XRE-family HTH domain